MARIDELNALLFRVETAPLRALANGREVDVPGSRAVVRADTGRVLAVVGREYRLVTHAQALELAFDCACEAFPVTRRSEWRVAGVDAPAGGGSCAIDLHHSTGALNFLGLAAGAPREVYGPFVRVANSYNRSRALTFDIGYLRLVCSNGMVLRDQLVRFSLNHQRRDIGQAVHFEIPQDRLAGHRAAFQAFLAQLQGCHVPAANMGDLACAALELQPPRERADSLEPARDEKKQALWRTLQATVQAHTARYADELGENAYAVFNAVTDLASRPPVNPLLRRDRHGLQRLAGNWASSFSAQCAMPGFELGQYLRALEAEAPHHGRLR